MPVVDMRVRDDVNEFAGLETGNLREHHQKGGVLHNVPVVRNRHIIGTLI